MSQAIPALIDARLRAIELNQARIIALLEARLDAPLELGRKRVDVPVSSFEALRQEVARQDVAREERRLRRSAK